MAHVNMKFYKAVCKQSVIVPQLGRCNVNQEYELSEWQAKGWGGTVKKRNVDPKTKEVLHEVEGVYFDIDWKRPIERRIKLSDEDQVEYDDKQKALAEQRKAEAEARAAAEAAPTAAEVEAAAQSNDDDDDDDDDGGHEERIAELRALNKDDQMAIIEENGYEGATNNEEARIATIISHEFEV